MAEEYIEVRTTIDKKDVAVEIARMLVERRLASCVQILGPIESTYWWRDKIDTTEEWLLTIKTKKDVYFELEDAIKNNHPYEVPEIIATQIVGGNSDYLKWISDEVR
ncbi:MAG: divalent-cation tolerance protein CutA [Candidatus Coatesbacteria bacterium]|nr:MAG: divalent-cation tolerance protein CutA [Candidatus Coatesbacteria bacterium]